MIYHSIQRRCVGFVSLVLFASWLGQALVHAATTGETNSTAAATTNADDLESAMQRSEETGKLILVYVYDSI